MAGYDETDVIDLKIYLMDELDNKGELKGKEVVDTMERFVRQGSDSDFLEAKDYLFPG
ncbi:MAG: hypothetical protein ABEJ03_04805 [Candidatus Nanohaloarchaea archaeon]